MLLLWSRFVFALWVLGVVIIGCVRSTVPASADVVPVQNFLDTQDVRATPVAGPFEYPWSLAFLPDGSMLVTEKIGRLNLVASGAPVRSVSGVPKVAYGHQGGLLDVVLGPDYDTTGTVYLSYSHQDVTMIRVRVMMARFDRKALQLVDPKVVFETSPAVQGNRHLGGRMVVTANGELFLTLGERGEPDRAQDLSDHGGTVVRLKIDGHVPEDNPFVGSSRAKPEIWSYGHRNAQGLAIDPQTGDLWLNEHGPRGGDELNLVKPGRNYGWPIVSYGINYIGTPVGTGKAVAKGIEPPLFYWAPSIAPSGLAIMRDGERLGFWLGGLSGQTLIRLLKNVDGAFTETRFLYKRVGRVRDVRLGPDGYIYILTDSPKGYVYRVEPTL